MSLKNLLKIYDYYCQLSKLGLSTPKIIIKKRTLFQIAGIQHHKMKTIFAYCYQLGYPLIDLINTSDWTIEFRKRPFVTEPWSFLLFKIPLCEMKIPLLV